MKTAFLMLLLFFMLNMGQTLAQKGDWTTFTIDDGLAGNLVYTIIQDSESSLWFGTMEYGISKFKDGIWTTYNTSNCGLVSDSIECTFEDRDGYLWFGTMNGVSRFKDNEWVKFNSEESGLANQLIHSIYQDRTGAMWFCTYRHGAIKFSNGEWTSYNMTNSGLSDNKVHDIVEDRNGVLWFGTWNGVCKYSEGNWEVFNTANSGLADNRITDIYEDSEGALWFATWQIADWAEGGGVNRYKDGIWETYSIHNSDLSDNAVFQIFEDHNNNMWFATWRGGACRYKDGLWNNYTTSNSGLLSNCIFDLKEDDSGTMWFATSAGASRYQEGLWITYDTTNTIMPTNSVIEIFEDSRGVIWIGNNIPHTSQFENCAGLHRIIDGQWDVPNILNNMNLKDPGPRTIIEDSYNNLWFGHSWVTRYWENNRAVYDSADGLPHHSVRALFEDSNGFIWVGTNGVDSDSNIKPGGLARYSGNVSNNSPKILFDESHGERNTISKERARILNPEHPEWIYYGMLNSEMQLEYSINRIDSGALSIATLNDYNVLILAAPDEDLTPTEIQDIVSFVSDGGALMFIGDYGLNDTINDLLLQFGIEFSNRGIFSPICDYGNEGNFTVVNMRDHESLGQLPSYRYNWGGSFESTEPAIAIGMTDSLSWRDMNWNNTQDAGEPDGPFSVICISEYGQGRVFCISDNTFNDGYVMWDTTFNDELLFNALQWLTGKENCWQVFNIENSGIAEDNVLAIAEDNDGRLYFGHDFNGVSVYDDGVWENWTPSNSGLTFTRIQSIIKDSNGAMWFGNNAGGASKYKDGMWTTYNPVNSGLVDDNVQCIYEDNQGAIWFGTYSGLSRFKDGLWGSFTTENSSLAGNEIFSITEDRNNQLWVGTDGGISIYKGDVIPPYVRILDHPQKLIGNPTPLFTFSGKDFQTEQNKILYSYAVVDSALSPEPYYLPFSFTTYAEIAPIIDGTYTFYVRARDAMGNISNPATYTFKVDVTNPTTTIEFPKFNETVSGIVAIKGSAYDDSPIQDFDHYTIYYAKGTEPKHITEWTMLASSNTQETRSDTLAVWNTTGLRGTYQLKLFAVDTLDHQSENIITVNIVDIIQNIDNRQGGYLTDATNNIKIYFPPNGLAEDTEIQARRTLDVSVDNINKEQFVYTGLAYDIMPQEIVSKKPGTLTFTYADSNLADVGDEKKLSILKFNESNNSWSLIGGTVNESKNQIATTISQLGKYGLFENLSSNLSASLSQVNCQPRVFSPRGGGYDVKTTVSFNLGKSSNVAVKIYNLSGRLKKVVVEGEYMNAGMNVVDWDGRDKDGNVVPSGLYIVTIEGDGKYAKKTVSVLNK